MGISNLASALASNIKQEVLSKNGIALTTAALPVVLAFNRSFQGMPWNRSESMLKSAGCAKSSSNSSISTIPRKSRTASRDKSNGNRCPKDPVSSKLTSDGRIAWNNAFTFCQYFSLREVCLLQISRTFSGTIRPSELNWLDSTGVNWRRSFGIISWILGRWFIPGLLTIWIVFMLSSPTSRRPNTIDVSTCSSIARMSRELVAAINLFVTRIRTPRLRRKLISVPANKGSPISLGHKSSHSPGLSSRTRLIGVASSSAPSMCAEIIWNISSGNTSPDGSLHVRIFDGSNALPFLLRRLSRAARQNLSLSFFAISTSSYRILINSPQGSTFSFDCSSHDACRKHIPNCVLNVPSCPSR